MHSNLQPQTHEPLVSTEELGRARQLLAHLRSRHGMAYQPHHKIFISKGQFTIKTVESWSELLEVLKLRHSIFQVEQRNQIRPLELDLDELDLHCDHVGVFSGSSLIGTYRLTSNLFSQLFYCTERFELDEWLSSGVNALELGRACVHVSHRKTSALHLLWRGIVDYAIGLRAEYLFGSASLPITETFALANLCLDIDHYQYFSNQFWFDVTASRRFAGLHTQIQFIEQHHRVFERRPFLAKIPALFQFYLSAGARIGAEPAFDQAMKCADFLTLLNLRETSERHRRKYLS